MGKCYTIVLLCALLASSMCAPAPLDNVDEGAGGETGKTVSQPQSRSDTNDTTTPVPGPPSSVEIDTEENPLHVPTKGPAPTVDTKEKPLSTTQGPAPTAGLKILPIGTKPKSKGQLIHMFMTIVENMPLSDLKLLETTVEAVGDKGDLSEFEGMFGALTDNDDGSKKDGLDVFSMIEQLQGSGAVLQGILKATIIKKEKSVPTTPGNVPETPSPGIDQSSSQNDVKLDGEVERLVDQQLLAAIKALPSEDLERIMLLLTSGSDPSKTLTGLQSASPNLSDDLIKIAVKYPSELKAVINTVIFERNLNDVVATAATVVQTKPSQPTDKSSSDQKRTENIDEYGDENRAKDEVEGDKTGVEATEKYFETEIEHPEANMGSDDDSENSDSHDKDDLNYPEDINDLPDWNNKDLELQKVVESNKESNDNKLPDLDEEPHDLLTEHSHQQRPTESGGWFGAWHFLIIFLVIAALVGVGYFCSHNRKKIREGVGAYISDAASRGRRSRNYRYKPVSST